MKSDQFTPMRSFEHVLQSWWLLVLAALLGAVVGFLISFALPARYEAFSQISTQLDYTDASDLEDYEEDRAVNEVGWVCVLDPVFDEVQRLLKNQGFEVDRQFMLDSFSVERTDDLWNLRVVHADPQIASQLANIWVDECFSQLNEAYGHALQAETLQVQINALESCTARSPSENRDIPLCQFNDPQALSVELQVKTEELQAELALARLLHPDLQFSLVRRAQMPEQPTRRGIGVLVFAGASLAFILMLAYLLAKGKKNKKHA